MFVSVREAHGDVARRGFGTTPAQLLFLLRNSSRFLVWCPHRSDGAEMMFKNHCKAFLGFFAAVLGCQLSLKLLLELI